MAVFGDARDYVIAMQLRGAEPAVLEGSEPKSLPPARRRNTLDDYKAMYRELPSSPQHWLRLITADEMVRPLFSRSKKNYNVVSQVLPLWDSLNPRQCVLPGFCPPSHGRGLRHGTAAGQTKKRLIR